jgi:hypothetical protein
MVVAQQQPDLAAERRPWGRSRLAWMRERRPRMHWEAIFSGIRFRGGVSAHPGRER